MRLPHSPVPAPFLSRMLSTLGSPVTTQYERETANRKPNTERKAQGLRMSDERIPEASCRM